jgi:hypothetical protein
MRKMYYVLRRRNKRITNLEQALSDCKKRNILSDEAYDSLNYSFHPVASELILNEVKTVSSNL